MPTNPKFTGRVNEAGKIELNQPDRFRAYLETFRGQQIDLLIRRHRRTRSNNQNRYYWGVVVSILAESFGYSPDEMHNALAWRFLRLDDRPELPTVRSTTTLTTGEFERYLEAVRTWASIEQGVFIPLPNEVDLDTGQTKTLAPRSRRA